ncbi:hypothetical protein BKA62DRAFT_740560 [Auriculariales sp. MPI-PUGE-AT-0066]|nr:hypothetical protein BKA62DRAFT_740560 [Auriculariales sp. MPI-PUGE-AT-0066]
MPPHFAVQAYIFRKNIATSTLNVLAAGHYDVGGTHHQLKASIDAMRAATELEPDRSPLLSDWREPDASLPSHTTQSIFSHASSLVSLRKHATDPAARVGVLNFANASSPGGGFEQGAQAQEESLARSSTLYASLTSERGRPFYESHDTEPEGLYTNAMLWSPRVRFFRADDGAWLVPVDADVLTSPAVNASEVRARLDGRVALSDVDQRIADTMRERMARVLRLFEVKQTTHVVLGSFGTGAFGNDVATIARIWAELLGPNGRFRASFPVVDFAIIDEATLVKFKDAYEKRCEALAA